MYNILIKAGVFMSEAYTRRNPDGTRSVYYPEARKKYEIKYRQKTKQYNIKFGLSEQDIVFDLENLISASGLTANAYIKNIIIDHIKNNK